MSEYKICKSCVMDTTDPDITFDKHGICNHCRQFDYKMKEAMPSPEKASELLDLKIREIKQEGDRKEYNCIIGLSGGTDSSYVAYLVKRKFGLNPLAIHLDNGWDSKLAAKNIRNIVRKLEIDLHTHVIDWEEFRDLQRAYLKASVIDIEAITDHAINATMYLNAEKHGIRHIIYGTNRTTEQILPRRWRFNKADLKNIHDIHSKFGTIPLKTYPEMGYDKLKELLHKQKIGRFDILNYINYHREEATKILQEELGWVAYGHKHYESIFTRFYQGYILPRKFNVDKRKCHYSTLIKSGQMTREQALNELKKPPYPEDLMKDDYAYVIKKLGFTPEEFEEIMHAPVKSHFSYETNLASKLDFKVYPKIYPAYKKLKSTFPFVGKIYDKIKVGI